MQYTEFRNKLKNYPVFYSNIFEHMVANPGILRRQVTEWCKKGYIIPLKRGLYTLREDDRKASFSLYFLANQLCIPSYVSLESALSYYGLIPEKVTVITSVSTKKTQQFKNQYGFFKFHHIKTNCFDDFVSVKDEFQNNFFIASPERALIDFFYFRLKSLQKVEADIFTTSYRLQNLENLDKELLKKIAQRFGQKKLNNLVALLLKNFKVL